MRLYGQTFHPYSRGHIGLEQVLEQKHKQEKPDEETKNKHCFSSTPLIFYGIVGTGIIEQTQEQELPG